MGQTVIRANQKLGKSAYRQGLRAATFEGFPAIAIILLLGGPYWTGYLLYLGASSLQVGIVLAIPQLAGVVQIAGAFLIQKFQNRKLALIVFGGLHRLIWTLTGAIPFLFPRELWMDIYIPVVLLAFISNSIGILFWTSMIADMVPVQVRGRYFGFRNTVIWAFGCAVLIAGGQVLDRLPEPTGFNILFLFCGVCVVLNLVGFFRYPNPPFEQSEEHDKLKMLAQPFRHRPFMGATLFIALWLFLQGISVPFFNYVMLDRMKINYQWISMITMTQNLAMMASYYVWGNLNVKYSARTLLYGSLPLISASCLLWLLVPLLPAIPVLIAVHALLGAGSGGFNQMMFTFVVGDTPKSDRPMFVAVFYALTGLAGFLGPLLGGYVYKAAAGLPDWVQLYGISSAVGFVLLLVALFPGRQILKDKR